MKRHLIALIMALSLVAGCSASTQTTPLPAEAPDSFTVAAATYPLYLFTRAVTAGVDGVTVNLITTADVSCLHDYTLTVQDMKVIEAADVVVRLGYGDEFLSPALAAGGRPVLSCAEGVSLLCTSEVHDHDHSDHGHDHSDHDHDHSNHDHNGDHSDETYDPHLWLDPTRAATVVENIAAGLAELDPDRRSLYLENAAATAAAYVQAGAQAKAELESLTHRELITFHDGFAYLADALGLTILAAIEEEAGSEASARDLTEVIALVKQWDLPAIFTEVSGSDASAQAISQEFDPALPVYALTTMMNTGLETNPADDPYLALFFYNVDTLKEALG